MAFWHKEKLIKSATLFGFGKSNRAVFEYLCKKHPELKITLRLQKNEAALPNGIEVFKEDRIFERFDEDLAFISPSLRRDAPRFQGKLLSSDAELFFEKNERTVFAITGSDGKSTTTTLAKMLLATVYENAYAIGNIGIPFTEALSYPQDSVFSAELSSFQLMNLAPKSKRAIITNITPNHLDWHNSFEEYVTAKENVLKNCDEAVLFLENDLSFDILKRYKVSAIASATLSEKEIKKFEAQIYVYIKDSSIYANGEKLLELSAILRGEHHNVKNFLSALALTYGYFDKSKISAIAKGFCGLPHRFEQVIATDGFSVFNSSIDSSPQRTLATLTSQKTPFVLIMGGRTKMKNFEILRYIIEKNAHALVLTGENRYQIYEALNGISTKIYVEENFYSAVEIALTLAKGRCNLIFSPASTSYDSFENFEKRGEAFALAARNIYEKNFK